MLRFVNVNVNIINTIVKFLGNIGMEKIKIGGFVNVNLNVNACEDY